MPILQTPVTVPANDGGTDSFTNANPMIIALEANPIRPNIKYVVDYLELLFLRIPILFYENRDSLVNIVSYVQYYVHIIMCWLGFGQFQLLANCLFAKFDQIM